MDLLQSTHPAVLLLITFGICLASGFLPFVNAELFLLGAAALAPNGFAALIVVAAATGQLTAKTLMFAGARTATGTSNRFTSHPRFTAVRNRVAQTSNGGTLVFVSAAAGLPPFYLVSVASGMLRMRMRTFVLSGFAGRLIRFSAIAFAPELVQRMLP